MIKNLYKSLLDYKKLNRSSFHTPGHKGTMNFTDLFSVDLTELPLTDSLYEACGLIKTAEESISKLYGTKRTLYSSGGNTLCIQAMLRLCAPQGGNVICDRVVHRSAVGAMALLGIQPIWIPRKNGSIDPFDILKELETNSNIKGVFLTSPDYYGRLADIKNISEFCQKVNIPLLIDNAHGSHLMFLEENLHPINFGATLVADSAHKTLPVLTSGAWLHIMDEKFVPFAKDAMALFGSTSPSYPVMTSLDLCRKWLENHGKEEFKKLKQKVDKTKEIAVQKGITLPSGTCDPVRITLNVASIGYTGLEFREHLYKFNIEPEFCDENNVVLIPTPFNKPEDWSRLENALLSLSLQDNRALNHTDTPYILPKQKTSLREALLSEHVVVDIQNAENKIAAQIACPCPPGVPIVMPGEIIGECEQKKLINYGITKINVLR